MADWHMLSHQLWLQTTFKLCTELETGDSLSSEFIHAPSTV